MRNRWINPANGDIYDWAVNHSEEDETGKARTITRTAPTGLTGAVRQQGDEGPYVLRYHGTILDRHQYELFWRWYRLCATQTIYFRDFDGQEYEVQITSFQPKRVRNLRRPGRDPVDHHWEYTLEMEVITFRTGVMKTARVTP